VVDFVSLLATAQRLITENGRSITFIRHDKTLQDTDEPWKGPASARGTPDATSVHDAVFVEPASAVRLGIATVQEDLIMKSDQIMILAAGVVDLTRFQEVLDGGTYWKITVIKDLKPGSTTVLSFVGVAR